VYLSDLPVNDTETDGAPKPVEGEVPSDAPSLLSSDTLMCFEGLVSLLLQLGQVRVNDMCQNSTSNGYTKSRMKVSLDVSLISCGQ
jgi:hypothetical protein